MRFILQAQPVTPNCDDVVIIGVNLIQAVAKPSQQRVESLLCNPAGVFLPNRFNLGFTADHLAGVFVEQRQKVELLRRKRRIQLHSTHPNSF